jgi:hypothetical protein
MIYCNTAGEYNANLKAAFRIILKLVIMFESHHNRFVAINLQSQKTHRHH